MITKPSFVRSILKEYFPFFNIKSIQEPVPLKHVLFFTRLTNFLLFMKDDMLGLKRSRLKSPLTTLLSYPFE